MGAKRFLLSSAVTGVLMAAPALVRAESSMGDQFAAPVASDALSLAPSAATPAATPGAGVGTGELNDASATASSMSSSSSDFSARPRATRTAGAHDSVKMLDAAAPATESPKIHGFFEAPFKTAYITPRGLVVIDRGLVVQPVGGLVFDAYDDADGVLNNVSLIGGVWNDINTAQQSNTAGYWNEMDPFFTVDTTFLKSFELSVTYVPFLSPPGNFRPEHNIETKFGFNDTDILHDFALHPYVKYFYEIKGPSTVVLGRNGGTYDVELGISPSYTYKGITDYPLTFTFPAFVTVGPKSYWGTAHNSPIGRGTSHFGTFQVAVNASVPLSFIPVRYGYWHADAGVTYIYDINHELRAAAQLLGNGNDPSRFVGEVGVGVNF